MPVPTTYIVSARDVPEGSDAYGTEPGELRFHAVRPSASDYAPSQAIAADRWRKLVLNAADGIEDEITGKTGNVLIFVHGYNNQRKDVLWRTRKLQQTLSAAGWQGVVLAFDWPSDNSVLGYLEDRHDAAAVADRIVNELLPLLVPVARPTANGTVRDPDPDCKVDVHLIGHSTGAFVAIEAFARAQSKGELFKSDWRLGQLVFIAGDVAAASLAPDDAWAQPMMRRIVRLTNYSNGHDAVLGASNAKRLGLAPRAGRVGAPETAHAKVVNVDCTRYFETLDPAASEYSGTFCHSWHIGNPRFALDLALTLEARSDRHVLATRETVDGRLVLNPSDGAVTRPAYADAWNTRRDFG